MHTMWLVVMLLVAGACGPSNTQIMTAKAARYRAPGTQVMDVALQVTQRTYKIGEVDLQGRQFATQSQWYAPTGGRISPNTDGRGEFINAGGGDIQLTLIVRVRDLDTGQVMVEVIPKTFQLVSGSPKPRELPPDDPNVPGWVHGRVDTLSVAIYEEAQKLFETQTN